ncbi:MAG: adenosylmethionine decarboxylase [Acidobacteriota bacterium]
MSPDAQPPRPLAEHTVVDYVDCSCGDLLDQPARLRDLLIDAAQRSGATVVGDTFHHFSPQGVTGVVLLAESHLAIHTWPERAYAAVDLFTCGHLDPSPGIDFLGQSFGAGDVRRRCLMRGP